MTSEKRIKKRPRCKAAFRYKRVLEYNPIRLRSGKVLIPPYWVARIKAANKLPANLFDDSSSDE